MIDIFVNEDIGQKTLGGHPLRDYHLRKRSDDEGLLLWLLDLEARLEHELVTDCTVDVHHCRTDGDPVCRLNSYLCVFIKIDSLWIYMSFLDRKVFPHDRLTYLTLVRLYLDSLCVLLLHLFDLCGKCGLLIL